MANRTVAIVAANGAATLDGGGAVQLLQLDGNADVTLFGLELSNGLATEGETNPFDAAVPMSGGAIFNFKGVLKMISCNLTANEAMIAGGAIHNHEGELEIISCQLFQNRCAADGCHGGAIFSSGGLLHVSSSALMSNVAADDGGAIYANAGELLLISCNLLNNEAGGSGGAMYSVTDSSESRREITSCVFHENESEDEGGAVYVTQSGSGAYSSRPFSFSTCEFTGNSASKEAGALYISNVFIQIDSCVVSDNQIPAAAPSGNWFMSFYKGDVTVTNTTVRASSASSIAPSTASSIFASNVAIDYGNCTPGRTPGADTEAALIVDGDFTGCPFKCPTGTYGPGGSSVMLRELETSSCALGCAVCPAGAVCPSEELGEPMYCAPGKYNPDVGSQTASGCRECSRGTYNTEVGSLNCTACPAGSYADEPGSTSCSLCGAGGYCAAVGADSASVFELYPGGTFSNATGLTSSAQCVDVGVKEYAPAGSVKAETCPESGFRCPGRAGDNVNDVPGSKPIPVESGYAITDAGDVVDCSKGYWCSGGNAIPCAASTYNDQTNQIDQSSCQPCPEGSTSPEASISIAACLCYEGYYDELIAGGGVSCRICPVGADCREPGLTLETIPLERGYWRKSSSSVELRACDGASSGHTACIGGNGTLCKPWTTGPYCTLCNVTDGSRYYDKSEMACLPCEEGATATSVSIIIGAVLILVLAVLLLAVCRARASRFSQRLVSMYGALNLRAKIKQLISLYQIAARIPDVFLVPMPQAVTSVLMKLDVFSLKIDSFGLPMGCFQLHSFENQLFLVILAPIVLIVVTTAGGIIFESRSSGRLHRSSCDLSCLRVGLIRSLPANLLISFMSFPMVSSLAFQAFACDEFDDGTSHLRADYSVDCHDAEGYGAVKALAWTAVFIYPIGVPLVYLLLLTCARDAIRSGHPSPLSRAIDFLHRDLEPRCYLWEIAEIAKKLFLVGFASLISPGETRQLIYGFGFCLVYLLFTSVYDPYVHEEDDLFSVLCNFVLSAWLFMCLVLKQAVLTEEVESYLTDSMRRMYYYHSGRISAIFIFTIAAAGAAALFHAVQQLHAAAGRPIIRLKGSGNQPELALSKNCVWHLFLSHVWGTGQDQNASIKRQLCLLLPGVEVFLDVDDLESIDALEEYIEKSQVIQFFCSKGYFSSRNCLREVRETLKKAKPVTLMFDPEKGGAPLEVIRDEECPADLRGPVFDGRALVKWYRIHDFQLVSLKLLIEQLLISCPSYQGLASLPLFIPRELTQRRWGFAPPVTITCSPNNPGARESMQRIEQELSRAAVLGTHDKMGLSDLTSTAHRVAHSAASKAGKVAHLAASKAKSRTLLMSSVHTVSLSSCTGAKAAPEGRSAASSSTSDSATHSVVGLYISEAATPDAARKSRWSSASISAAAPLASVVARRSRLSSSPFVLYLSRHTWIGEAGDRLANEVRDARAAGLQIVMVHSTPDNDDGCEFSLFFSTTPNDLVQAGLYKALAFASYPAPFHHVSACLVARALGAIDLTDRKLASPFTSSAPAQVRKLSGQETTTPACEASSLRARKLHEGAKGGHAV